MKDSIHRKKYFLLFGHNWLVQAKSDAMPFPAENITTALQENSIFLTLRDRIIRQPLSFEQALRATDKKVILSTPEIDYPVDLTYLIDSDGRDRLLVEVTKPLEAKPEYNELTSTQRLKTILDSIAAGAWEFNYQTGEAIVSERWATMMGYTLDELAPISSQTWFDVLYPDDAGISKAAFDRHFNGVDDYYSCEVRLIRKDGSTIWVRDHGKVVTRTDDGQPEWVCGAHIDISHSKRLESALIESRETLQTAQKVARMGYWKANWANAKKVEWSDMLYQLLGLDKSATEPSIYLFKSKIHPDDLEHFEECERQALTSGVYDLVHRLLHAQGHEIWVHGVGQVMADGITFVGTLRDVTSQKKLELELTRKSQTDSLTGLYNRAYFLDLFEHHLSMWHRKPSALSLLVIDIDNFKKINDQYGHLAGDIALKEIADIFNQATRPYDICARIGGEEFVVLLPNTELSDAVRKAEELRALVARKTISTPDTAFSATLTIGVSQTSKRYNNWKKLYSAADTAMYEGKKRGRNQVIATPVR